MKELRFLEKSKDIMKSPINKTHEEMYKAPIPGSGYPDNGNNLVIVFEIKAMELSQIC